MGQTNITFKLRWNNHKSECKLPHKEKATCLSKYVWYLKRKEINFTIKWSVASVASPYSRETGRCQLCTMEKTLIALQDRDRGLNRRGEVMTRCWHKDIHLLTNWVGERPALLGGQDVEGGGGAAALPEEGDDVQEAPGQEEDANDSQDVEKVPGQVQQPEGVAGGEYPEPEDADSLGPLTRSRASRKKT